jgi:hypothetical protein
MFFIVFFVILLFSLSTLSLSLLSFFFFFFTHSHTCLRICFQQAQIDWTLKIREADGDYLQLKRNSSSYSKSPQSEDTSSAASSSGSSSLAATAAVSSAVKPFKISFRRIKVPFEDVRNLKPLALQFATADLEEVKMYTS